MTVVVVYGDFSENRLDLTKDEFLLWVSNVRPGDMFTVLVK